MLYFLSSFMEPSIFNAFSIIGIMIGGGLLFIGGIAMYISMCYGLHLLVKKYEPTLHPAWSWIPVANVYPLVKISEQPLWMIAVLLLGSFVPVIGGIVVLIGLIFVYNGLSKRTKRGTGTTLLLIFFSAIMIPWLGLTVNGRKTTLAWVLGIIAIVAMGIGGIAMTAGTVAQVANPDNSQFIDDVKGAVKETVNNPEFQKIMQESQQ